MEVVLMDAEAHVFNDETGMTYILTLMPATFNNKTIDVNTSTENKKSSYSLRSKKTTIKATVIQFTLHKEHAITIVLRDSVKYLDNLCKAIPDEKMSTKIKNKIDEKIFADVRKGFTDDVVAEIKSMDFRPAMEFIFNEYIPKHGGHLGSFCILLDLKNLESTQNRLGVKPIFKNIDVYPETGLLVKKAPIMSDIRSIIGDRSKKFVEDYINFISLSDAHLKNQLTFFNRKYISTSLESFMTFLSLKHNNKNYEQSHNSIKDVEDLFELITWAIKYDGLGIFDGKSYLHEPKDYSTSFKF
jgi:hypothetical protein